MKFVFPVLVFLLAGLASAGDVFTNWQDTNTYVTFKADSLKLGKVVNLTSSTANALIVMFNDTNAAGYKTDTVKFKYGYRLGWNVINASGKLDTAWGYKVTCASVSTLPADTAGKWISHDIYSTLDSTTGQDVPLVGMMDSNMVTGFAVTVSPFTAFPRAAQYVQPWIKGLTGNRTNGWIKVRSEIMQTSYLPVRNQ